MNTFWKPVYLQAAINLLLLMHILKYFPSYLMSVLTLKPKINFTYTLPLYSTNSNSRGQQIHSTTLSASGIRAQVMKTESRSFSGTLCFVKYRILPSLIFTVLSESTKHQEFPLWHLDSPPYIFFISPIAVRTLLWLIANTKDQSKK